MATANVIQTSVSGGTSNALAMQGDGFFLPKLNTASRTGLTLTSSDAGFIVFDTTLNNLFIWNGAAWESVPASGDSTSTQVIFNDNGILAGDAGLLFDKATGKLTVDGNIPIWRGLNNTSTNIAVGFDALKSTTAGAGANTVVGFDAGESVTTGSNNSFFGNQAGIGTTIGSKNVAVGSAALFANGTGGNNVAVGNQALGSTTGSGNIAIGATAGSLQTTGNNNIIIGVNARTVALTDSSQFVIGSATEYVATNGGASTYYPDAVTGTVLPPAGSSGFIRIILNGSVIKVAVYTD